MKKLLIFAIFIFSNLSLAVNKEINEKQKSDHPVNREVNQQKENQNIIINREIQDQERRRVEKNELEIHQMTTPPFPDENIK